MHDLMRRIEELTIPEEPGAEGWDDFAAAAEVHNAVEAAAYGTDELSVTADEELPDWLDQEWDPRRLFVVRAADGTTPDGGGDATPADAEADDAADTDMPRIVARGVCEFQGPGSKTAWLRADVLPGHRNRGIGTALFTLLESVAEAKGCVNQIVYAASPDAPGERLVTPTGFGSLPLRNPEVRFLLRRGYRLEQVERGSRLTLPADRERVERLLRVAEERAGRDYEIVQWHGVTPIRWQRDLARLYEKMSTGTPTAGLEEPAEPWPLDRFLERQVLLADGPRTVYTTAVVHRRSRALVGFTELTVPAETDRPINQEDTLVVREHRGHRLGLLLKCWNLESIRRDEPGHPSVITFNAEENRHMLAINEALGFEPFGYEGGWRRRTPESSGP
jgi:GNAT superfamily N-acetyltransferase